MTKPTIACYGALYRSSAAGFWAGETSLGLYYNYELTPEQVRLLSENPWQIFEPEITWQYIASGIALNQHSFRFFNDDGLESASSFAGGINGNVDLQPSDVARIRLLIDSTGDISGKQFQLEYRRKLPLGSFDEWKKVVS
jgi:hypothetical protein